MDLNCSRKESSTKKIDSCGQLTTLMPHEQFKWQLTSFFPFDDPMVGIYHKPQAKTLGLLSQSTQPAISSQAKKRNF